MRIGNISTDAEIPLLIQIDDQTWVNPSRINAITCSNDKSITYIHQEGSARIEVSHMPIVDVIAKIRNFCL